MVRILVYGLTESFGGVEKIMLDLFSYAKEDFMIDFVFSCDKPDYFTEFETRGFKYRRISKLSECYKFYSDIVRLCNEYHYDVAYCNVGFSNIILYMALRAGNVGKIVFHSHNTMIDINNRIKRLLLKSLHYISKYICSTYVDGKLACSELAYQWLFGTDNRKQVIVHNAIKVENYTYDKELSKQYRMEIFGNKDVKVVGHIGRFSYQKNHEYLLEIFRCLLQFDSRYRLLLVGNGELYEKIRRRSIELGIDNKTVFAGFQSDVKRYYQAMNCFILPSRFEGLSIVGIEAQASGLPCFFSNTITKEIQITNNVKFLSIQESPMVWANEIHRILTNSLRCDMSSEIRAAGYDIDYEAKKFINLLNNFIGEV